MGYSTCLGRYPHHREARACDGCDRCPRCDGVILRSYRCPVNWCGPYRLCAECVAKDPVRHDACRSASRRYRVTVMEVA